MGKHGANLCSLRNYRIKFLELANAVVAEDWKPDHGPFLRAFCIQHAGKSGYENQVVAWVFGKNPTVQNGIFRGNNLQIHTSSEKSLWSGLVRDEFGEKACHERKIRNSRQRTDVQNNVGVVRDVSENRLSSLSQCTARTNFFFRSQRRSYF